MKRSGRTLQEDWPEFADYARTNGTHFAPLLSLPEEDRESVPPSPRPDPEIEIAPISPIIRERRDTESHGPRPQHSPPFSSQQSTQQQQQNRQPKLSNGSNANGAQRMSLRGRLGGDRDRKSIAPTIIARDRAIEKSALVEGAERIYLRYLLPGGEREIYLPYVLQCPISNLPLFTIQFHPKLNPAPYPQAITPDPPFPIRLDISQRRHLTLDPRSIPSTKNLHLQSPRTGRFPSFLTCQGFREFDSFG